MNFTFKIYMFILPIIPLYKSISIMPEQSYRDLMTLRAQCSLPHPKQDHNKRILLPYHQDFSTFLMILYSFLDYFT